MKMKVTKMKQCIKTTKNILKALNDNLDEIID